jgi:4-amino-4-deoxy-L-arabinose transferase-like glycosyltransferase
MAGGPLSAVLLLALVLRFYNLTYHSLWFDEVMSTYWATKPAGELWRVGLALTQDKHPPLYYLLLHGWTALFGPGDWAVRSLTAVIGALAVLPTYGIGAHLGGRRAGLLAALLLALNPFLVWYSQEARMFMPATTFALVGLYGMLRIDDSGYLHPGPHGRGGAGCRYSQFAIILGFTAALYTYLFSAFLLPVAAAWLALAWWLNRQEPVAARRFWTAATALAVVGLLFLPLARSAWLVSGDEATPGRAFAGMGPALWRLLQVYAVGWPRWSGVGLDWVAVGGAALAVVGLAEYRMLDIRYWRRQHRIANSQYPIPTRFTGLFLALWLLLPILAGGLLLTRDRTVFAETRYFIFLVPALCLAWGRALAWAWGRQWVLGVVVAALMLGITAAALPANWSPQNRREAWREAAAFVQTRAGPNDAVVVQADYVRLAFERYFAGPQPVFYPFTERLTVPAQVNAALEGLAGYDAVWLVQSHHAELDPDNLVASWFGARYPLITGVYPAGIALHGFAQGYRLPALPADVPYLDAVFDNLRLLGCIYAPKVLSARDDLFHPPSGWVHVTAYWTAAGQAPATDIFPLVRLVDAAGQVWGQSLERGNDATHVWPTSRWLPGEVIRVDYDVNLNPLAPRGTYRLVIEVPGIAGQAVCGVVGVTSNG